jgi:VWFA-related protein
MFGPRTSPLTPRFFSAILCVLCASASCFSCAAATACARQQPEPQDFRLKVAVDVVNVDVTVTDAGGKFITGLKRENFRILDEAAERPITNFASIEEPAKVLLLVETSPAVMLIFRQHVTAAHALLKGLAPDDWVGVATYADKLQVAHSLTQDKDAAYASLNFSRFGLGSAQLNFFNSVSAALDGFAPVPGKKALVLLTTGLDTSPPGRWDALAEKLRSSEVVVYAVALGGELRDYRESASGTAGQQNPLSFEESSRALTEMATMTGGNVYFPRKADEFPVIFRQVAATIRHRYSLGFAPAQRDGKYRRIFVQLLDDQGRVLGPFYGLDPSESKSKDRKRGVRYRLSFRRGYMALKPE